MCPHNTRVLLESNRLLNWSQNTWIRTPLSDTLIEYLKGKSNNKVEIIFEFGKIKGYETLKIFI